MALLGNLQDRTVLDLACGDGVYARQFNRAGSAEVTGVDISPAMVAPAEAQEQAERSHPAPNHEPGRSDVRVRELLPETGHLRGRHARGRRRRLSLGRRDAGSGRAGRSFLGRLPGACAAHRLAGDKSVAGRDWPRPFRVASPSPSRERSVVRALRFLAENRTPAPSPTRANSPTSARIKEPRADGGSSSVSSARNDAIRGRIRPASGSARWAGRRRRSRFSASRAGSVARRSRASPLTRRSRRPATRVTPSCPTSTARGWGKKGSTAAALATAVRRAAPGPG